jgi:EAL domain-containing protein (putative c-di-GMP-specific phosphodiesterase class I)
VSLSIALAHIIQNGDGTCSGVWGPFQLRSAFQPIFAFRDGKLPIAAFEGLIRPFRNDEPVSPAAFFASLPAVDRLHVETLTRVMHLTNAAACLPREASIFVNFDPSVFVDRAIADAALHDMRQVLHQVGLDPQRIVCEVTEKRSGSAEALYGLVQALRANGFRIAVDDYGSEESDIERIKALRPEIVKFDAYWITRLMESGPGLGLLTAMVEMFTAQGIVTVFEGIEENWQLELAEKSGASMVQGYVLARPELAPTSFSAFTTAAMPAFEKPAPATRSPVRGIAPHVATRAVAKAFGRKIAR